MTGRVATAVRLAALAGLIALVILGGGGLWLARSEWGQRWVAEQVRTALGPSVRFASARMTPWPPPLAVELEGVELRGEGSTPIARAHRVVARIRLRALIGRPPLLASLRVAGFEAEIVRAPDGTVRLGDRPLGGGDDGSAGVRLAKI